MGGKLMPVEVYPVVASVVAAMGCSAYALKRKWVNDPQVTIAKGRRSGGTSVAYEGVDEAIPFWANISTGSISIFGGGSNPIRENKKANIFTEMVVTVPIAKADDEEEAEDETEDAADGLAIIQSADELTTGDDA